MPPPPAIAPPLVIAHRGASAERPEHTLGAYERAIALGADYVELDVVPTRDGALVCRHENELSETTDVAERAAFADRRTTKVIDGRVVTGWFSEDFDLDELHALRARERLPDLRPQSARYDGQWDVPTLEDAVALVQRRSAPSGGPIGLYIETKHPSYFAALGLALEAPLVAALHAAGYDAPDAPVYIESFEGENLRALAAMTPLRLVQLLEADGRSAEGAALTTREGLAGVAAYAAGIGPHKDLVLPRDARGRLGAPTALVGDAHEAGLVVHPWTFRPENRFLPADHRRGAAPAAHGDLAAELRAFLAAGVDGVFADDVAAARGVIG